MLETKGEAIQAMALHNLSRIDEGLDLITGTTAQQSTST